MRSQKVVVVLDESEKRFVQAIARHDGLSASSVLRQLARREAEQRGLLPAAERPPLTVGEGVQA